MAGYHWSRTALLDIRARDGWLQVVVGNRFSEGYERCEGW